MSNGFFQIAGVQTGTASGGASQLGPFTVNFGSVPDSSEIPVNTTQTVGVPSGSNGVIVIPPAGNITPTLQWSTVSLANAAGNFIAPGTPSIWEWDQAHVPANLYLVSGGNVAVVVQFI